MVYSEKHKAEQAEGALGRLEIFFQKPLDFFKTEGDVKKFSSLYFLLISLGISASSFAADQPNKKGEKPAPLDSLRVPGMAISVDSLPLQNHADLLGDTGIIFSPSLNTPDQFSLPLPADEQNLNAPNNNGIEEIDLDIGQKSPADPKGKDSRLAFSDKDSLAMPDVAPPDSLNFGEHQKKKWKYLGKYPGTTWQSTYKGPEGAEYVVDNITGKIIKTILPDHAQDKK